MAPQPGTAPTEATPGQGIAPSNPGGWAEPMKLEGNSSASERTEFGYARGRLHAGLDYGGFGSGSDPDGVFAASEGVVVYAQDNGPGYGNLVEIKRGDGWTSRYAHLASMDVSEGQQVTQGARVGTRGNTGGDFDIHLHFEIRSPDGQPVDPRSVLPAPGLSKAF